ncbi:MAG: HNH endonuclease signature motif containing protein [Bdellovibrionota bacterium]
MNLQNLTDTELLTNAKRFASKERNAMADLLVYLVEINKRDIYLEHGYSSMFDYLTRGLKFSESGASRRIKVTRFITKNPKAIKMLRDGDLSLSTACTACDVYQPPSEMSGSCCQNLIDFDCFLRLVFIFPPGDFRTFSMSSSILEETGKSELLIEFKGASKKKSEIIAAGYRKLPDKKIIDRIKPLGKRSNPQTNALELSTTTSGCREINDLEEQEILHEIRFTAGSDFTEKLEQVKKLLSGKFPAGASLEQIFTECMDTLLDKKCPERRDKRRKAKVAKTKKPVVTVSKPDEKPSRHIPSKIRDEIYLRDKGQCTFESPDGTRCCTEHDLEIDHIIPFSVCKSHEVDNLRLLCRKHNMLMAEQAYGAGFIRHRIDWKKSLSH